ncbi:hypothetical protein EC957_006887, partial [Mortierella hygrophila]
MSNIATCIPERFLDNLTLQLTKDAWTIYAIAEQYGGYIIRKSNPYHCERHLIEKIWACIKNKVAALTNGKHTSLSLKITLARLHYTNSKSTFLSVWNESNSVV